MGSGNSCVAVYDDTAPIDIALALLTEGGFGGEQLSLIGRAEGGGDCSVGLSLWRGQLLLRGRQSPFWERVWQRLPGAALLFIPAIGPVVTAGVLGGVLVAALEEVVSGLNILRAALYRAGIPNESIAGYENAVKEGAFLLIVEADSSGVERAYDLLLRSSARDMAIHLS